MTSATIVSEISQGDYGRPTSIEEATNRYLVHPLSSLIAKAAIKANISANQLSIAGLLCGLSAAAFYFYQPDRTMVFAGFVAMSAWHVFDGADGRVARATGTSSAFGRIIDGICDHLVFAAVYISLTLSIINGGASMSVWFLVVGAGASHAFQAAAYEERRQRFQRRAKGVQRSAANEKLLHEKGRTFFLASGYDRIQRLAAGNPSQLDEALNHLRARNTEPDVIRSVMNRTALVVRRWSVLNANNRTIMIALACFVGQPVLYFAYEVIILNAVVIGLIVYEKRVEDVIVRDIAPIAVTN